MLGNSRVRRPSVRRLSVSRLSVGASLVGLAVAALAAASPADAAGAVGGGVLIVHGPGSVYAAPGSIVTAVTTAGGTATYAAEVVNRGTDLAQFTVHLSGFGPGALTFTSGSTNITTVAEAERGYFTKLLAPGKSEALTLKVKMPTGTSQITRESGSIELTDTDGNFLNSTSYETEIKATTGPYAGDMYTSTAGESAVITEPQVFGADIAAEAIKPNGKTSFTVKVQNDSQTPGQYTLIFDEFVPCGDPTAAVFPVSVKVGSTDITPAVEAGAYQTPVLAHGKSLTLTVAVSYPPMPPAGCGSEQYALVDIGNGQSFAGETNLLVNLSA